MGPFYCLCMSDWSIREDHDRTREICARHNIACRWNMDGWAHIDITDANKDDILNDDDCNDIKMYSMVRHFDKIEELMAPWGEIHKYPIES